MADELQSKHSLEIELAVLKNELGNLKGVIRELKESNQAKTEKLEEIESRIEEAVDGVIALVADRYVTKVEWDPVKKIVFGLVSIILLTVIGAALSLIIKKN
jgi:hypothetical protein